jgi:hypothetical protein
MKRTSIGSLVASLVFLLSSAACVVKSQQPGVEVHDHTKQPAEPATPAEPGTAVTPGTPATPPTGATEPGATPATPTGSVPVATNKGADGAECQQASDCDSGVCEGMGCNVPGRCIAKGRMCTQDLRPYCGCDGKTFQGSGSCPGRRFASRGECPMAQPATPPAKLAEGADCTSADQCDSGVCEGKGCDAATPGKCVAKARRCTRDMAVFCGCDGKTFRGSGTCPGARFSAKGACGK